MRIVKISSLACTSCIIVNNTLNKIKENYELEIKEIDYDFDDYEYEVGDKIPVLIFESNEGKELSRLEGESSYEKIKEEIEKYAGD